MKKSNSNVALDLEAWVIQSLQDQIPCTVYSHVPDDARLPLVRIGEISWQAWLLVPESYHAKCTLTVFSDEPSNQEAITIAENVTLLLKQNARPGENWLLPEVVNISIYQLTNQTWCADIEIECRMVMETT
jgi:hypothetical protein